MYATTSGSAKPTSSKTNFRDKRYVVPCLLVDLSTGVYDTTLWSGSQVILRNVCDDLVVGEEFTGTLGFEDASDCGLFQARVVRVDPARKMVGAEFLWLSAASLTLIAARQADRKPDASDTPVMQVSVTHKTVNWSLSGMLLERYQGELTQGQAFGGMIRLEKAQEPGRFEAVVIRADAERRTLALKFNDLPSSTFTLLEAAMKKTTADAG
jgi:hypothetical protein